MSRNSFLSIIANNFFNFTSSYPGMVAVSLGTTYLLTAGLEDKDSEQIKPSRKNERDRENKSGKELLTCMYANPASFFKMVHKGNRYLKNLETEAKNSNNTHSNRKGAV